MLVVKRCMIVTASNDLSDLLAKNIEAVTSVRLTRYVIVVIVAVTDGIHKRDCRLGTCEASRFDSISNRTSDSGFDS